jgi:hypothetical protein
MECIYKIFWFSKPLGGKWCIGALNTLSYLEFFFIIDHILHKIIASLLLSLRQIADTSINQEIVFEGEIMALQIIKRNFSNSNYYYVYFYLHFAKHGFDHSNEFVSHIFGVIWQNISSSIRNINIIPECKRSRSCSR